MIPRMTTVGNLKNYRYNLNRSGWTMSQAMTKIETQRNFNSFAEDPAAAARCFQLRRSYLRASSQLTLNESVYSKYQQAWKTLDGVSEMIDTVKPDTGFGSILEALNDPIASGRNALGQTLVSKADGVIQSMNGRYGENFVFSGADTLNVPFTWKPAKNPDYIDPAKADPTNAEHAGAFKYMIDPASQEAQDGALYTNDPALAALGPKENPNYDEEYMKEVQQMEADAAANGTTVDVAVYQDKRYGQYLKADGYGTGKASKAEQVPQENPDYDENSSKQYLKADGTPTSEESEAGRKLCYRGVPVDSNDNEKLNYYLNDEKKFIDLGLGFQEREGEIVESSVFNEALQGVYYLGGTGTTSKTVKVDGKEWTFDDMPNNVVSVMEEFGQILLRCDPDSGAWASDEDKARAYALAQQFEDSASLAKQRYDELDAQSGFLRDNGELLTSNAKTLNEQFLALEDVDPAAAIEDYMYAKYCYDTALKVGNSILSQSLMDYMNL
jgi:flagellin-like hook-associated protein FlgL